MFHWCWYHVFNFYFLKHVSMCILSPAIHWFNVWHIPFMLAFAFKSWRRYKERTEGISRVMQSVTSSRIGPKNQGKQIQGTIEEVSKDQANGWARMTEGWQEGRQSQDHVSWPLSLTDRPGWSELLHWWSEM